MVLNVAPLLCDNNPGTFSSKRYGGRLALTRLAISKNKVPLASSKPCLFPATEKAWHVNHPLKRSNSGSSSGRIFFASLQNHSPSVLKIAR